jgi:transposase
MGRNKVLITKSVMAQAEAALQTIPEGKLAIQLTAIIATGERTIEEVSQVMRYGPRTITRWIHNFVQQGVAGLQDRPKGHMRAKLDVENRSQVERWITSGKNQDGEVIHWTLQRLQNEIKKVWGISLGITPLWKFLHRQQLVLKRPRPIHAKADLMAQEAFKKNERNHRG